MACGAPVITSKRGSLQEIAGDAAEYIDPIDIESIKEGLLHVLCDTKYTNNLRRRGIQRAAQFSWSDAANQTRQIYRDAIHIKS
jgi:glycosyltransferase involved in cell wall biosynthesis